MYGEASKCRLNFGKQVRERPAASVEASHTMARLAFNTCATNFLRFIALNLCRELCWTIAKQDRGLITREVCGDIRGHRSNERQPRAASINGAIDPGRDLFCCVSR